MTLVHPYAECRGPWLRGNLHTHTTNSDGRLTPAEVVQRYAAAGHDFLAISDHDFLTPPFEHPTLLSIPAVEVTADGPHLLAVGATRTYKTAQPRGAVVAEIMADDALCILNHPNWGTDYVHWEQAALMALGPYHGIEIHNSVIDRLQGEAYALDRWDQLLSGGRLVWGYSHDDFHDVQDGPRSFNVVCARRDPTAIVEALKAGRCYASSGLSLDVVTVEDDLMTVAADEADLIRFVGVHGTVLSQTAGSRAQYRFTGQERYVRAECWGPQRRAAFTQPVFVERP